MQTSHSTRCYFANLDGFEQLNRHDLDQFLSVSAQRLISLEFQMEFLLKHGFSSWMKFLFEFYDRQTFWWMEVLKLWSFFPTQGSTVWVNKSQANKEKATDL